MKSFHPKAMFPLLLSTGATVRLPPPIEKLLNCTVLVPGGLSQVSLHGAGSRLRFSAPVERARKAGAATKGLASRYSPRSAEIHVTSITVEGTSTSADSDLGQKGNAFLCAESLELIPQPPSSKVEMQLPSPMLDVAGRGDLAALDQFLTDGGHVDAYDHQNACGTLLHSACTSGREEMVQALLSHSASVVQTNSEGKTALHVASVAQNQPIIIQLLLDAKAEVNARDNVGSTPVSCAAGRGHDSVLCVLLAAGANPRMWDNHVKDAVFYAQHRSSTRVPADMASQALHLISEHERRIDAKAEAQQKARDKAKAEAEEKAAAAATKAATEERQRRREEEKIRRQGAAEARHVGEAAARARVQVEQKEETEKLAREMEARRAQNLAAEKAAEQERKEENRRRAEAKAQARAAKDAELAEAKQEAEQRAAREAKEQARQEKDEKTARDQARREAHEEMKRHRQAQQARMQREVQASEEQRQAEEQRREEERQAEEQRSYRRAQALADQQRQEQLRQQHQAEIARQPPLPPPRHDFTGLRADASVFMPFAPSAGPTTATVKPPSTPPGTPPARPSTPPIIEGECDICLEPMLRDEHLEALPCAHLFHSNCVQTCLLHKRECPRCRLAVPDVDALDIDASHI